MRTHRAGVAGAVVVVAALAGCGSPAAGDGDDATLTVFAAASLREAFEPVAADFEAAHPGVDVRVSYAGSSSLAAQVREGAPADVLASANRPVMDALAADGLVTAPQDFATNTLEIAVPPGNPAGVTALADLADPALDVVVCAPAVPCGSATTAVEAAAGVELSPVSEEQNVTDVLAKVVAGEADAGLVYVTDVAAAGDDVEGVAFDESASAVNTYPIATVTGSPHAALADELVAAVLGDAGQATLASYGFGAP